MDRRNVRNFFAIGGRFFGLGLLGGIDWQPVRIDSDTQASRKALFIM